MDSVDLVPAITVSDNGSGAEEANVIVSLDGQDLQAGEPIVLYTLPLGSHTLFVSAADAAGNIGRQTVTFEIATHIDSLKALIDRFKVMEWIDSSGIANSLKKKLDHGHLEAFIHQVKAPSGKHVDLDAAVLLLPDARWLLQQREQVGT
ncbi:hypothetical protein OMP38_05030 [Cohnella ginsengisoli]|uniref:Bacterial Ig-like domain-containing protein n=1 Tax=Cohnella ginsengisoli TaxID=425004 RepID=A0A9X4KE05_9BACL|nr:hypothetical protein [Cohnella ginsengisoli]MDG0790283.1 hypothetical protein [Cohnella ginsengisoli]